jgi:hypothetical protein
MKLSVARACIIALHKMYIPDAGNKLRDTIINTIPGLIKQVSVEQILDVGTNATKNDIMIKNIEVKVEENKGDK